MSNTSPTRWHRATRKQLLSKSDRQRGAHLFSKATIEPRRMLSAEWTELNDLATKAEGSKGDRYDR